MHFHKTAIRILSIGLLLARLSCGAASAQNTPHASPGQQDTPPLRATAVLEYLGDIGKPTASRLLPIAVWDGESYQPGALYLAQPAPLAVQAGTQYELEQAGTPRGLYDVNAAERIDGGWIGVGKWQPLVAPAPPKLHVSRTPPAVVREADSDRPHLVIRHPDQSTTTDASGPASGTNKTAPPPAVDPERPTLHHRSEEQKPGKSQEASGSPVTATADLDPDRPHLRRGIPADLETIDQPSKLEGNPANMRQIVAISDVKNGEAHPFVYSWSDPSDAAKMQAAMELVAQKLLAPPAPSAPAPRKTTASATRRKKPAAAPLPPLSAEVFKAYELSYSGGATLVFTARSGDGGPETKYVTLIAQPDFYGNPQVLFKQVTTGGELDVTPRMSLVDAADTDGDHRAELIFELRSSTQRRFTIYRVTNGGAVQAFVSTPLP